MITQLLRNRLDIPNQAGFVLVLVRADGSKQLAKVARGEDGCHYCATPSGTRISLNQSEGNPVAGWLPYVAPIGPHCPGMVCLSAPAHYTREQLVGVFASWGCTEKPPATGKAVWINFPPGADFPLANVSKAGSKSITGKTLFTVWLYRKAA